MTMLMLTRRNFLANNSQAHVLTEPATFSYLLQLRPPSFTHGVEHCVATAGKGYAYSVAFPLPNQLSEGYGFS
jgi:hypothetical protein